MREHEKTQNDLVTMGHARDGEKEREGEKKDILWIRRRCNGISVRCSVQVRAPGGRAQAIMRKPWYSKFIRRRTRIGFAIYSGNIPAPEIIHRCGLRIFTLGTDVCKWHYYGSIAKEAVLFLSHLFSFDCTRIHGHQAAWSIRVMSYASSYSRSRNESALMSLVDENSRT